MSFADGKKRDGNNGRENEIREKALLAREIIKSRANYTRFRICDLAKDVGIELTEDEIPLFVRIFDHGIKGEDPEKATFHALTGYHPSTKEYSMDTYVCRRGMIRKFSLVKAKDHKMIRSVSFTEHQEVQIRNYDEKGLRDGTIYPVPEEDYLSLMMIMDQWYRELDKENPPNAPENSEAPADWQVEFNSYTHASFYDPRYNHAEEVLGIIRRIHPEIV